MGVILEVYLDVISLEAPFKDIYRNTSSKDFFLTSTILSKEK